MALAQKTDRLSYAEYLEMERVSEERHTFWDGEIFAMAGGSWNHSLLETRISALLVGALEGRPCRALNGNRRLRSPQLSDRAVYPDVSVICGKNQPHPDDPDASTNPVVVIEVLSPTTEQFDRGKKFAYYRTFPSLRSYVLVYQDEVTVEHFSRDGELWTFRPLGRGMTLHLQELEVQLLVDEIYQDTELLAPAAG